MANVLTGGFASISQRSLRVTATQIRSFTTPAIYVPFPSGYGGQKQVFLNGATQSTGSVTVGGSVAQASQTASSYGDNTGSSSKGFPTWAIAVTAGVGGVIVAIIIAIIAIILIKRRRRDRAARKDRWSRSQAAGGAVAPGAYRGSWVGVGGEAEKSRNSGRRSRSFNMRSGSRDFTKERGNFFGARGPPVPAPRPAHVSRQVPNSNEIRRSTSRPQMQQTGPGLRGAFPASAAAAAVGVRASGHGGGEPRQSSSLDPLISHSSPRQPNSNSIDGLGWSVPITSDSPARHGFRRSEDYPRRVSQPVGSPYGYNAVPRSESHPDLHRYGAADALMAGAGISSPPRGHAHKTSSEAGGYRRGSQGPPRTMIGRTSLDMPQSPRNRDERRTRSAGRPGPGDLDRDDRFHDAREPDDELPYRRSGGPRGSRSGADLDDRGLIRQVRSRESRDSVRRGRTGRESLDVPREQTSSGSDLGGVAI